ncbi:hypothetical protein [Streptomyces sp. NPDC048191]
MFPNPDTLKRYTTAVLTATHDEWITFPAASSREMTSTDCGFDNHRRSL